MLEFYTRPTIPFKLECEALNNKQKLIKEISEIQAILKSLSVWNLWYDEGRFTMLFLIFWFAYFGKVIVGSFLLLIIGLVGPRVRDIVDTIYITLFSICYTVALYNESSNLRSYPSRVRQSIQMIESLKE